MDRSLAFYRDVLGLTPGTVSPYWSDFSVGGHKVGLHPSGPIPEQLGPHFVLGLETDDLLAVKAALDASGTASEFHQTPGGVILQFTDPDGSPINVIQLGTQLADFAQP